MQMGQLQILSYRIQMERDPPFLARSPAALLYLPFPFAADMVSPYDPHNIKASVLHADLSRGYANNILSP
jgi:hypothetical protein